jgi:hypothetical protein
LHLAVIFLHRAVARCGQTQNEIEQNKTNRTRCGSGFMMS